MILTAAVGLATSLAYGCAAPAGSSPVKEKNIDQDDRPHPVATVIDARPVAIVNGRGVNWGELRPLLNEAAGPEVLREYILNRLVHETAVAAGVVVGHEQIETERQLLLDSLSDDPDTAIRLLETLREQQGLGKVRFERLLSRNAALRAMVRDRVQVTDADVQQLHEVTYGPKRQGRIIVTRDLADARAAGERIAAGEPFMDVAVRVSIDSSAPRGGLLEPIALADASYPEALRLALWRLDPGETSQPILVDGQYALLMLVREINAQEVPFADVRDELARQARLSKERLQMDQLARRLTEDVSVTIFDDVLHDVWRRARRR